MEDFLEDGMSESEAESEEDEEGEVSKKAHKKMLDALKEVTAPDVQKKSSISVAAGPESEFKVTSSAKLSMNDLLADLDTSNFR